MTEINEKYLRPEVKVWVQTARRLKEEVENLKNKKADQEKIIQSWKDACRIERELVESKNETIKKLKIELEKCKKGTHPGR